MKNSNFIHPKTLNLTKKNLEKTLKTLNFKKYFEWPPWKSQIGEKKLITYNTIMSFFINRLIREVIQTQIRLNLLISVRRITVKSIFYTKVDKIIIL